MEEETIAIIIREETGRRLLHNLGVGERLLSEEDARELFGAVAQYFGPADKPVDGVTNG